VQPEKDHANSGCYVIIGRLLILSAGNLSRTNGDTGRLFPDLITFHEAYEAGDTYAAAMSLLLDSQPASASEESAARMLGSNNQSSGRI
jgi:hypothetical protein